jgi:hypothetical protein
MNPPTSEEQSPPDRREQDLALRRYDIVIKYLVFEHTIYWSRSQFYVAANTALLVVAVAKFPTSDFQLRHLAAPVLVAIVGLVLSIVWLLALLQAGRYADRWRSVCQQLEEVAFESYEVLRNPPKFKLPKLRTLANSAAVMFVVLWTLVLLAAIFLVCGPRLVQPAGGYPGWS